MIDCYCDYDPPEFSHRRQVQCARKAFSCEECGRRVPAGEPYEYVFGKWDGYESTFKTCCNCLELRTWVARSVPCFCWAHANMIEDARETCFEAAYRAPEETAGLRFGVLRRIAKIRQAAAA